LTITTTTTTTTTASTSRLGAASVIDANGNAIPTNNTFLRDFVDLLLSPQMKKFLSTSIW
jgi:hypothetical protein